MSRSLGLGRGGITWIGGEGEGEMPRVPEPPPLGTLEPEPEPSQFMLYPAASPDQGLRALAAETTGELEVLGLDGDALGVDGREVG
jgi:hypothetical protein